MKYSIIIPTWNGEKLLRKNLPQVLSAIGKQEAEVIVVDNGSTDGSVEFLEKTTKNSIMNRFIRLKKNYGFAYACNLGVKRARGEIIALLNNDVVPEKGFLAPLAGHFQNNEVFAVSFHEPQFSWAWGEFRDGFLKHQPGPKTKTSHISLWASGGSGAFRKRIWQQLEGFDLLYHPFYWEDVDLAYRAWKRGYQVLWEPKSVVHHRHESTVSRFSKTYIDRIKQRNALLFIWKNITDQKLIQNHRRYLKKRIVAKPGYFQILAAALLKFPQVIARRQQEKKAAVKQDREIFNLFTK